MRDVYGATIDRIKVQDGDKSRLGMTALMWISHAERPLRADELCHALAVKLGSTDFDVGNIPSMPTLMNCCQGLITVDGEASTVRLIHFTLQEYLSSHPDIFSKPHSAMAEICLTYLNSQSVKAFSNAFFLDARPTYRRALNTQSATFLEYCSVYWGVHAKRELSDCGRSLALELLKEDYSEISTRSLLAQVKDFPLLRYDTLSPFSGLHCASFFGIVEVVAGLIEMECYDINEGDFSDRGPLAWAAWNGHEEVVETLLRQERINPDKPNNRGRTPLSDAASNGYEGVVKILLRLEEVSPDKPDDDGRTPFSYAAENGYQGVVKVLLGREEVNLDRPDNRGQTPLSYAAQGGDERVVKILLGREEVNSDRPDKWGITPLSRAAWVGQEGVVKILLGREEISPDEADNIGRTPLSRAAQDGHEGVVKILLGREEVNPDKPDNHGQTPLSWAAQEGREGVVKILLELEEVNPDKADNDGRTPLSYAAEKRHERVVALLESRKVVSPPYSLSPRGRRLAEITAAPSLSRHATRRDALGHHPLPTGGIYEIGMQIYIIPFCVFLVIFIGGWVISEFLFPTIF